MSAKMKYQKPQLIGLSGDFEQATGAVNCYLGDAATKTCGYGNLAGGTCQGNGTSAPSACQANGNSAKKGCTSTGSSVGAS